MASYFNNCCSLIYFSVLLCFNQFVILLIKINFFLEWIHVLISYFIDCIFSGLNFMDLGIFICKLILNWIVFALCFQSASILYFPVYMSLSRLVLWLPLYLAPWNSISEPDVITAVHGLSHGHVRDISGLVIRPICGLVVVWISRLDLCPLLSHGSGSLWVRQSS